jgi:hypothetical protein
MPRRRPGLQRCSRLAQAASEEAAATSKQRKHRCEVRSESRRSHLRSLMYREELARAVVAGTSNERPHGSQLGGREHCAPMSPEPRAQVVGEDFSTVWRLLDRNLKRVTKAHPVKETAHRMRLDELMEKVVLADRAALVKHQVGVLTLLVQHAVSSEQGKGP